MEEMHIINNAAQAISMLLILPLLIIWAGCMLLSLFPRFGGGLILLGSLTFVFGIFGSGSVYNQIIALLKMPLPSFPL